ncbi:MAG: hypothetical protein QGD94_12735 [Planctomycetia bacterium]|nr:hypothetical protein [Planctomycetia bacterium]
MTRLRTLTLMLLLLLLGMAVVWLRQDTAQKAYRLTQINRQCRQLQKQCYRRELEIARLRGAKPLLSKNENFHLGLALPGAAVPPPPRLAATQ